LQAFGLCHVVKITGSSEVINLLLFSPPSKMASGTAYRWKEPARDVLNLYPCPYSRKAVVKLYRAPHNRALKAKPPTTPVVCQLPVELLRQILLELDLPSLGMLRRVNTTTRSLVESLPEYFLLRNHASDTLRVMDATDCASRFPIRWLYAELCHPWCRTCTDFGPFLYLPTISRSCFLCNTVRPEFQLAPVPDIQFRFGLSQKDAKSLPIIRSLPADKPRRNRVADVAQAKALGLRIYGSLKKMKRDFRTRLEAHDEKDRLALVKWHADSDRGHYRRVPQCRSVPRQMLKNDVASRWRLLATTSFPYWDRQKRTLEPGAYCRACTYHWEERQADFPEYPEALAPRSLSKNAYYRAFLEADLPEHFLHCPAVKRNYNFSDRNRGIIWPFMRSGTDFIVDANNVPAVSGADKITKDASMKPIG
jgi:hypothetical protein